MSEDIAVSWFAQLRDLTGSDELSILLMLMGSVLAAIGLHAGAWALMRRVFNGEGTAQSILKRIVGPTRLAAILLALIIVMPAIEFNAEFTENRLLKIGIVILLGWSAVIAINAAARRIERRHRLDVEDNLTARRMHTQINILCGAWPSSSWAC